MNDSVHKAKNGRPPRVAHKPSHQKGPLVEPKGYLELSLEEAARKTPPTMLTDTEAPIDMAKMRRYRLGRIRAELKARDIAACLLVTGESSSKEEPR